MTIPDFSEREHFPGTITSHFDGLVRLGDIVEGLPLLIFLGVLFLLALLPTRLDLAAVVLWLFMVVDYVLLAALPRAGKSFGPAKPPTLILAVLRLVPAVIPSPWNWMAQALGTGLVVYGFWVEPYSIRVTRQTLQTTKWRREPDMPPLRVLHLGDLHVERITGRERQLLDLLRSLKPDLILFSGDFLNLSNVDDPVAWEQTRQIMCEFKAPLGVFAVTGSPPVDPSETIQHILDGLPVHWLREDRVTLDFHGQAIDIVGVTCTHRPFVDGAALERALKQKPANFTILLYHTPDLAPRAAKAGIDLQLSGHTHGGQVRLPFFGALYTSSLYGKRFEMGRYQVNGMTLYVTRGIGLEGKGAPRVRFLCPPEIVLWEICAGDK
jgi:predicted MPP superfamily phosphohydrolase